MSPQFRKFKKEYAHELLSIAEGDFGSATALFQSKLGRSENILYHCQQSIEKILKAVICFNNKPIHITHDLEVLASMVEDLNASESLPHAHSIGSLNQYATIRRYEEGLEELSHDDFKRCLDINVEILNWAKKIIS